MQTTPPNVLTRALITCTLRRHYLSQCSRKCRAHTGLVVGPPPPRRAKPGLFWGATGSRRRSTTMTTSMPLQTRAGPCGSRGQVLVSIEASQQNGRTSTTNVQVLQRPTPTPGTGAAPLNVTVRRRNGPMGPQCWQGQPPGVRACVHHCPSSRRHGGLWVANGIKSTGMPHVFWCVYQEP